MQQESSRGASNAGAPAQPAFTITTPQRDPPDFAGLRGDDVEEWLDHFNRVSSYNRWDDTFKLRIVAFSLTEVAKTWFFNNRDTFDDWSGFTQELRKVFGTSSGRLAAKKKLDARVQHAEETYASYIEDVLALCRRVDKDMPETDKVRHIIKGVSSFAFNAMAIQNPATVADVRSICQRLDQLQAIRLQPDPWSIFSSGSTELRSLIRAIIREEFQQRDAPCHHSNPVNDVHAQGLRDIIREELAAVTTVPRPSQSALLHVPTYSEAASRQPVSTEHIAPPTPHGHLTAISTPSAPPFFRSTWRAPRPIDDRPVCYYCGIRGHISRFCRRRQQDERRGYAPYERDYYSYSPRQHAYSSSPRRRSPPPDTRDLPRDSRPSRRRSPSPFQRALSPLRPVSNTSNQHQEN